jgi:hypothetical protein
MARRNQLFPVALSILGAAEATKLPRRLIRRAVYQDATLEARMVEGRVRIPVICLVEWLRKMPLATLKAARKGVSP